jgi:hypothetical protein
MEALPVIVVVNLLAFAGLAYWLTTSGRQEGRRMPLRVVRPRNIPRYLRGNDKLGLFFTDRAGGSRMGDT